MGGTSAQWLYRAPRALGIAYAVFISLFALDVFEAGLPLAEQLRALAIHLVPTGIILINLAIAWKWERLGSAGFFTLGLLYLSITRFRFPVLAYCAISGPAFLISLLFLANWFWLRGPRRMR
ncbi:MAG: hypothetical protein EPN47_09450 [Acidobacteria bacterium]|nr:MAG: hypothetical protein EPN47_09450 [Acidobacteriota bacterium]